MKDIKNPSYEEYTEGCVYNLRLLEPICPMRTEFYRPDFEELRKAMAPVFGFFPSEA